MLPPDRSHLATEQRHEASTEFDALDVLSCISLMADDHRRVVDAVLGARESLCRFVDDLVTSMRKGGRLIYIGAGTSGRLGVLDASECPPTFQSDPNQVVGIIAGGDAALRRSSEGREDEPEGARNEFERLSINSRDTVLGIAAGGTTPYVLGGLGLARSRGALTGLLTCAREAGHPAGADHVIVLDTGPELLTGSTRLKAGSATKLALNIISTVAYVQIGKTYGNLMVDLRASNAKLRDRALRILRELSPHLSREEAAAALDQAGGVLKPAIVMQRLGVDFAQANALLAEKSGRLRDVIG